LLFGPLESDTEAVIGVRVKSVGLPFIQHGEPPDVHGITGNQTYHVGFDRPFIPHRPRKSLLEVCSSGFLVRPEIVSFEGHIHNQIHVFHTLGEVKFEDGLRRDGRFNEEESGVWVGGEVLRREHPAGPGE